ncbi:hypothetical protein GCM10010873_11190 [Cypionkella aquatica]|uniref:Uncharacterized protein n=1 Tax=Cypionkella aquatica TaxID=1756042 RepID=A0AA37TUL9_9RHOB|nr:hypothetical protein GCM10010873_11190 [Cypionkella aquatica]
MGAVLAVLALPLQAQTDDAAWQAALISQDIGQLQGFVKDHPQSPHMAEAEALLAKALTTARGMGLMPVQAVEGYVAQKELIAATQGAKTAAAYQAYLTAYPQGLFVGLAQTELALLALAPAEVAPPNPAADLMGLTFTTPFPVGEHVKGRSIAELIASATPQFSPIEGLPDAAWRDKTCANCHAWNEASLCDQAQTYTKPNAAEALAKPHPLGETFKLGLQQWALGGCK